MFARFSNNGQQTITAGPPGGMCAHDVSNVTVFKTVPSQLAAALGDIQTALFIQPTAIGTVYEDLGGIYEYQLRLTQPNAKEASSSFTISLILDVTLPTRLGLRPIALHTYLFLPQQHYIFFCPSSYPTFSESRAGQSCSLEDCGSILLAVERLDYIVITYYVSQLVNHLRTRTPMGDLAEQSRLALDSHYAYSIYWHYRSSHALVVHPSLSS